VGTVIQEPHQGNEERHQRWERLERAALVTQYRDLHAQGLAQRQAAQGLRCPEARCKRGGRPTSASMRVQRSWRFFTVCLVSPSCIDWG